MLAQIWGEVFKTESFHFGPSQINVHDGFFEFGGHSLAAMHLISRIEAVFEVKLPLHRLFESPSIAGLARYIEAERQGEVSRPPAGGEAWVSLVPIRPGGTKRPFYLVPGGGGGQAEFMIYAKLVYLLGQDQPVYGLQARGLERDEPPHSDVEVMAADYIREVRALQSEGPYIVGGECRGVRVAYEMAQQLLAQGQQVALVLLNPTRLSSSDGLATGLYRRATDRLRVGRLRYNLSQLRQLPPQERLIYTLDRLRVMLSQLLPLTHDQRVARRVRRVRDNYRTSIGRCPPRTAYTGRMTLLVTEADSAPDPSKGWREWAGGGLDIHEVPGDRWSYLGEHVQATAARLRAWLEAVQANGVGETNDASSSS
jgi:thioesterase domain-containing protein/acyl carrier protein